MAQRTCSPSAMATPVPHLQSTPASTRHPVCTPASSLRDLCVVAFVVERQQFELFNLMQMQNLHSFSFWPASPPLTPELSGACPRPAPTPTPSTIPFPWVVNKFAYGLTTPFVRLGHTNHSQHQRPIGGCHCYFSLTPSSIPGITCSHSS